MIFGPISLLIPRLLKHSKQREWFGGGGGNAVLMLWKCVGGCVQEDGGAVNAGG